METVLAVCCGVVRGSTIPGSAARRTVAGAPQSAGATTTLAFALSVPHPGPLDFRFWILDFLGTQRECWVGEGGAIALTGH